MGERSVLSGFLLAGTGGGSGGKAVAARAEVTTETPEHAEKKVVNRFFEILCDLRVLSGES